MRLKNIPPDALTETQRPLYGVLSASIDAHLKGFVTKRMDGALIGPFNALMHFPNLGAAVWSVFTALAEQSTLPPAVREIAILLTGARFSALYELYSHEAVAQGIGMSPESVAALASGHQPAALSAEETVAFQIVQTLTRGAQVPESLYRLGVRSFGEQGMAELACTVGCYATIASLLNTFDISLPGTELIDNDPENGIKH